MVLLLLTCGCRQIFGLDVPASLPADGEAIDASGDGAASPLDAAHLCFVRPSLGLGACLADPPMSELVVDSPITFATDTFPLCATLTTSTQDLCVVAAASITIGQNAVIHVTGTRPLVLVSPGSIEIDGTLDVSSHLGNLGMPTAGPDENPTVCGTTEAGMLQGGGAGGSFTTAGGDGGRGVANNSMPGLARAAFAADSFHGGCRGGFGASADTTIVAAYGGGALAMFAATVTVAGTINASGMAGHGGAPGSTGGYGGGTGGMVVISAPAITIANPGQIYAIGGGGGGGASSSAAGLNGAEAASYSGVVPGGQGGNNAGDGGSAFPLTDSGQLGGGINGAGGGGGGGVGAIVVFTSSTFSNPRISPVPQVLSY